MKYSLINDLVCPRCLEPFSLNISLEENSPESREILEGNLICNKGHAYPLVKGIPVLLPELDKKSLRVMKMFGFEWKQFPDYSSDNLPDLFFPLPKEIFSGKKVLDGGCGAGRHVLKIAESGAKQIIGIDISKSAEVAYEKVKRLSNADIVQTDICHLPFKPGYFDFIYSIGVLQHLPSPYEGFKSLINVLAPNGSILICVYKRTLRKRLLEFIRLFTKKLPLKIQIALAFFCAVFDYSFLIKPYRFFSRSVSLKATLDSCIPQRITEYAKYDFRVSFADWYDRLSAPITNSYTEQKIRKWFLDANLCSIDIRSIESFWLRGCGKKPLL